MPPRVSVVIPAFNNADFIEATVESVLAQSFPDFELIIADHESTDGTWELLQRYAGDARVALMRTPAGGGAERNWNNVTGKATGEFVKLVCGDDLLHPDSLSKQVDTFDEIGSGFVIVASPRDIVDARGAAIKKRRGLAGMTGRVPGKEAIRRSVRSGTNIFGEPCCVLIRREALESIGRWHGAQGYFIDYSTYVRLLVHGDLFALPETLASFRVSAGQWSVRLAREQRAQALAVHREVDQLTPGLLSPRDLRRGQIMALVQTMLRRIAYLVLGRRLRPHESLQASVWTTPEADDAGVTCVTLESSPDGLKPEVVRDTPRNTLKGFAGNEQDN